MITAIEPHQLESDWLLSSVGKQQKRSNTKYIDIIGERVELTFIRDDLKNRYFLGRIAFVSQYLTEAKMRLQQHKHGRCPSSPIIIRI